MFLPLQSGLESVLSQQCLYAKQHWGCDYIWCVRGIIPLEWRVSGTPLTIGNPPPGISVIAMSDGMLLSQHQQSSRWACWATMEVHFNVQQMETIPPVYLLPSSYGNYHISLLKSWSPVKICVLPVIYKIYCHLQVLPQSLAGDLHVSSESGVYWHSAGLLHGLLLEYSWTAQSQWPTPTLH